MKLTLIVEYLLVLIWLIYAYYNTHGNFRGHTCIMVNLSRGYCPQFVPEIEAEWE